jgi:5'-nucleotidase
MTILITNDDGLDAPGLTALEDVLCEDHQVWVIAPDREMSGQSHGITLNEGLKVDRLPERRFAVRGTPVDCVNLGLQAIMDSPPQLVISGINKGPNLGTDILYSGTCAAAREAALRGVPSVAVSFASFVGPWIYEEAAAFIGENLEVLRNIWKEDLFINVNWPESPREGPEVRMTRPGKRRYRDEMVRFRSPRGGEYWFLQPAAVESTDEEGTDTRAILDGCVSVGLISLEPVLAPSAAIRDTISWRGVER